MRRIWCYSPLVLLCLLLGLAGCGEGETRPKMDWSAMEAGRLDATGFYRFPWPNDLRLKDDGTPDMAGLSGTLNPLFKQIINQGLPHVQGFGTNSGVLFQFNKSLDVESFPTPGGTLQDAAVIMLVNIDPLSSYYLNRVPVIAHFDPITTLYQSGQLLTIKPLHGYALQPSTRYAAIVYNGLRDKEGHNILSAPLLDELRNGIQSHSLQNPVWLELQQQWQQVSSYVSDHTAWSNDQVAAFTVFTTMNPTQKAFAVARAIATIDDHTIMDSVEIKVAQQSCGDLIVADIRLPVWQQGEHPYLLTGGMIEIDAETQLAVQQGVEETELGIYIGCDGGGRPRLPVIYAGGTGASHRSGPSYAQHFFDGEFEEVMLSVGSHQTGERLGAAFEGVAEFLNQLGLEISPLLVNGIAFYNAFNPAASMGNQIQGAADQLYLRRVALLLPQILMRDSALPSVRHLELDFSYLQMKDERAAIIGFSQGAGVIPLVLAMDTKFDTGLINAAGSGAYFQFTHRVPVRDIIRIALAGIVDSEIDYFHPLMQVLQMLNEHADGANYVPYIESKYLLQTAGIYDGCVSIEASRALGLAFDRAGLMQALNPLADYDGYEQQRVQWPVYSHNRADGGVGIFTEAFAGHGDYAFHFIEEEFLAKAFSDDPDIPIDTLPGYATFSYDCEGRYEQGWNR